MKRGIIALFFLALVSLIGIAGAANTCTAPEQIILRLSDDTNAHGEVWDGAGNYPTQICYNQIFSGAATRGICNINNLILSLSKPTNAHAEGPAENTPGYDTDVCYGELSTCTLRTGNCQSGEGAVVRLSENKNAHLALSSDTNYNNVVCCTPPAGTKVCNCLAGQICKSNGDCEDVSATCGNGVKEGTEECDDGNLVDNDGCSSACTLEGAGAVCGDGAKEGTEECDDGNTNNGDGCSSICISEIVPPPSGDAYWARVSNNLPYADASIVYVDDTVKLIAKNIPDGIDTIDFIIYDNDLAFEDYIRTDTVDVTGPAGARYAEKEWNILLNDYNNGNNAGLETILDLYFHARGGSYDKTSQLLKLSPYVNVKNYCKDYDVADCVTAPPNPKEMNGQPCSCVVKDGVCTLGCENIDNDLYDNCNTGPCYYSDFGMTVCNDDNIMQVSSTAELEMIGGSCPADLGGIAALAEEKGCVSGTTQIPCGAPELQLPFFGITQFIIGLMGIAGIYALIIWKRERERGE